MLCRFGNTSAFSQDAWVLEEFSLPIYHWPNDALKFQTRISLSKQWTGNNVNQTDRYLRG